MRAVRWGSECGLAAGTLLKVRLVEKAPASPVDVSNLKLDENPITEVDTSGVSPSRRPTDRRATSRA